MERIMITREPQSFILVPVIVERDGADVRADMIIRTADIQHVEADLQADRDSAIIITLTFASRAEWYTPLTVREVYDLMCPMRETHRDD